MNTWRFICCVVCFLVLLGACRSSGTADSHTDGVAQPSESVAGPPDASVTETATPENMAPEQTGFMRDNPSLWLIGGDRHITAEFAYGNVKYIDDPAILLMVNGGFVNCGGIFTASGDMLVPADEFFEALCAEYRPSLASIEVRYREVDIRCDLNDGEVSFDGGSHRQPLEIPPQIKDGKVYVPVREFGGLLGCEVEISRMMHPDVTTVTVESSTDDEHDKAYTPEEAYDAVYAAAEQMYRDMAESFSKDMAESHYPQEGIDKIKADASTFELEYLGNLGRYYVFKYDKFGYKTFFNKYTGGIFGDTPEIMGFMLIRPGVADLSSIFWYDWSSID